MYLEVVPVPVADVDRARPFYAEQVGFVVDLDMQPGDGSRLVQMTPPAPGSLQGLMLMVSDIGAGRVRRIVPHPEGWRIRPIPPQKPDGIV